MSLRGHGADTEAMLKEFLLPNNKPYIQQVNLRDDVEEQQCGWTVVMLCVWPLLSRSCMYEQRRSLKTTVICKGHNCNEILYIFSYAIVSVKFTA